MTRISSSQKTCQSKCLNVLAEISAQNRLIARGIATLIAQYSVHVISEKTGIPAKDLHRYAKGAPIKQSNMHKLVRLGKIIESLKIEETKKLNPSQKNET